MPDTDVIHTPIPAPYRDLNVGERVIIDVSIGSPNSGFLMHGESEVTIPRYGWGETLEGLISIYVCRGGLLGNLFVEVEVTHVGTRTLPMGDVVPDIKGTIIRAVGYSQNPSPAMVRGSDESYRDTVYYRDNLGLAEPYITRIDVPLGNIPILLVDLISEHNAILIAAGYEAFVPMTREETTARYEKERAARSAAERIARLSQ